MMRRSSGTRATLLRASCDGISWIAFVVEPDLTVLHLRLVGPRDGSQRRGLAGTVATEQCKDLALADIKLTPAM